MKTWVIKDKKYDEKIEIHITAETEILARLAFSRYVSLIDGCRPNFWWIDPKHTSCEETTKEG